MIALWLTIGAVVGFALGWRIRTGVERTESAKNWDAIREKASTRLRS